jgi:hypothetical protein
VQPHGSPLSVAEQRLEVATWYAANKATLPEPVRAIFEICRPAFSPTFNSRKVLSSVAQELRRALGITPSSERRRSGSPLSGMPREKAETAKTQRERLEAELARTDRLGDWHDELHDRHEGKAKRLRDKLSKLDVESPGTGTQASLADEVRLEDIERTPEQKAASRAYGIAFGKRMQAGKGADPRLKSVNESLMPSGAVLAEEQEDRVETLLPPELENATVLKTLNETRVRYDFSLSVTRIELDVEKKVVVDENGERHVVTASTSEYGPPRYAVTWSALATLAVLVGQFAMPLNRLGTMLSTTAKRFTTATLSRILHYVAERLVPIYLVLAEELAQSATLAGDDTSCRVLEVQSYFAKSRGRPPESAGDERPWRTYQTPEAAEQALRRCAELAKARVKKREDGDREATRTSDESPSLGVLIGQKLEFESPRRNGDGAKQSMNTTVVSGRSVADDPRSLIVFYRSHLGSCGNLFESLLKLRSARARTVTLQGDLSGTNLVTDPALQARFDIKVIGCAAHARRPFANYEHEDPVHCPHMLHLFLGLAMHEQRLDVHGRNFKNVKAVRNTDSRRLWGRIRDLAKDMAEKWSKETKLGAGARYIIKHYDKLTAYLDDPRLEPTNNLRERMLRMEKLIEGSSMFRQSLEGRFVLDVVRTVLQTAVAAEAPVRDYLISALRADPEELRKHPESFTPRAWVESNEKAKAQAQAEAKALTKVEAKSRAKAEAKAKAAAKAETKALKRAARAAAR